MITYKDCDLKYPGDPSTLKWQLKYMVMWDVPQDINDAIPALPNKIYCNKDMIVPLENAFRNIMRYGVSREVKTWDGCFNVRKIRGGSSPSLHSKAVAVDINAAWNRLNMKPTMNKLIVKAFKEAGFDWGGDWQRLDGMHFQLAKI